MVLLLAGVFLAGVMLAVNDPDPEETIKVLTTVAAFFTFLARGYAVMRLSTLRDWLSVIEQAQNVEVEERLPETGEKADAAKPDQPPLLEEKPTLGVEEILRTEEHELIENDSSR